MKKKKIPAELLVALQLVLDFKDFKDFEAAKKTDEEVTDNTAAANGSTDAAVTMEAALPVEGETALAAEGETALVAECETAPAAEGETALVAEGETAPAAEGETALAAKGEDAQDEEGKVAPGKGEHESAVANILDDGGVPDPTAAAKAG